MNSATTILVSGLQAAGLTIHAFPFASLCNVLAESFTRLLLLRNHSLQVHESSQSVNTAAAALPWGLSNNAMQQQAAVPKNVLRSYDTDSSGTN